MGSITGYQIYKNYKAKKFREELPFYSFISQQKRRLANGYPLLEGENVPIKIRQQYFEYIKTHDITKDEPEK